MGEAAEHLVREARPADLPAIQRLYAHYVTETYATFDTEVPDVREWERKLAAARARGQPWRVSVEVADGRLVGYAGAGTFMLRPAYDATVTTAVYLDPDDVGRGLGRPLYGSLIAAVAQAGFRTAVAGVALPNRGSVALHEHFGFRLVGTFEQVGQKLGAWRDVAWFERRL